MGGRELRGGLIAATCPLPSNRRVHDHLACCGTLLVFAEPPARGRASEPRVLACVHVDIIYPDTTLLYDGVVPDVRQLVLHILYSLRSTMRTRNSASLHASYLLHDSIRFLTCISP